MFFKLYGADDVITFRQVASTVANRNGLYADLSSKPIKDSHENSFHISMSIKTKDNKDYLKQSAAGILNRIKDCTVSLNNEGETIAVDIIFKDSLVNPYITFAAIIDAAILGINNNEELKG